MSDHLPDWLPAEAHQIHADLQAYVDTLDLVEVHSFSVCVLNNLARVQVASVPPLLETLLGDFRRRHTAFLLLVLRALQRRARELNDVTPDHRDCSAFMTALNSFGERIRATPPSTGGDQ